MPVTFPAIRVGDPVRHGALSVFPLFAEPGDQVDYVLSDEAIDEGSVLVEEVSQSGSVPDLSVENKGDIRVLFLEGEEGWSGPSRTGSSTPACWWPPTARPRSP